MPKENSRHVPSRSCVLIIGSTLPDPGLEREFSGHSACTHISKHFTQGFELSPKCSYSSDPQSELANPLDSNTVTQGTEDY